MTAWVSGLRDPDGGLPSTGPPFSQARSKRRSQDAVLRRTSNTLSCSENIDDMPSDALPPGIMASISEFYFKNLATEVRRALSRRSRPASTPTFQRILVDDGGGQAARQRLDDRQPVRPFLTDDLLRTPGKAEPATLARTSNAPIDSWSTWRPRGGLPSPRPLFSQARVRRRRFTDRSGRRANPPPNSSPGF